MWGVSYFVLMQCGCAFYGLAPDNLQQEKEKEGVVFLLQLRHTLSWKKPGENVALHWHCNVFLSRN